MKYVYLFFVLILIVSTSANAEWFIRGTHNNWDADPMVDIGSNTMLANDVVFSTNGFFKFDRWGDWSENYGIGGVNGGNIFISSGEYDIQFYTDTKDWKILPATYHFRGTPNNWGEGTVMTYVPIHNRLVTTCQDFTGDINPRFKIDPNGDWGGDEFPARDFQVSPSWVRIEVDVFTSRISRVEENLAPFCGADELDSDGDGVPDSIDECPLTPPGEPVDDVGCPSTEMDFRSRTIYFAFVDRFANGDVTNDDGFNPAGTSDIKQAGDVSEWRKYWGGDIRGVIDNLDYLQDLGISAIWLTPLVDNINDTSDTGSYHGYWARDFLAVDEHVGDWELVDELDQAMEERGMKLIMDIALNQSNQRSQFEFGALYRNGVQIVDDATNDEWYHQNGDITDCGDDDPSTHCDWEWDSKWHYQNKDLFDLADFNHGIFENSIADEYLIDAALLWIEHGVDAFRIDAIKHVEESFVRRFADAVLAENPDIYIFGEWFGAGADHQQSMEFLSGNFGSHLLDFRLRDQIENAIADNISMRDLNAHIESRPSAMNNLEDWQPIFLDNHDVTRTSVYLQTTMTVTSGRQGKGFSKALSDARQNLGTILVMTLPGIPTIFYGTEHHATWFEAENGQVGADPYNRQQMETFRKDLPIFDSIRALADLRQNSSAVSRGTYQERWINDNILIFERRDGEDVVVVAVNKGPQATITVFNLGLSDGDYENILGDETVTVSSGTGVFNLAENSAVVLR